MLPGLTADLRIWACQRLAFGRRHRCIAVDNRGAGRSGKPEGPYTIAQMAEDALAVLDAEGVGSAHVLGYSMGSFAAQHLALHHPERVSSLVLAGSSARDHEWRRDLLRHWSDLAVTRGVHVMARNAFPWLLGPRTARRFGLYINALWPLILSQPAHAFVAQVDAILALDGRDATRSALTGISHPTLVVNGAEDRLMPPVDATELAGLIPGASLAILPRAAHGLMLEAAAEFNDAVLGYLAGPRTGDRALVG
jgi:3-oxoadipate enol-lactonase